MLGREFDDTSLAHLLVYGQLTVYLLQKLEPQTPGIQAEALDYARRALAPHTEGRPDLDEAVTRHLRLLSERLLG